MNCYRCLSDNIRYIGTCVDDNTNTTLSYHCEDCGYDGCESEEISDDDFPQDEGLECTMCGKPIVYNGSGMCASCRTVWNG